MTKLFACGERLKRIRRAALSGHPPVDDGTAADQRCERGHLGDGLGGQGTAGGEIVRVAAGTGIVGRDEPGCAEAVVVRSSRAIKCRVDWDFPMPAPKKELLLGLGMIGRNSGTLKKGR